MAKYVKLVREIPERYALGTNMAEMPWIRSFEIGDDCLVAKVLATDFYDLNNTEDQGYLESRLERDASNPDIKIVFKGVITFDDNFVTQVNDAAKKCRSFGEFAFGLRKQLRRETLATLGTDRDKKDFIRCALASR